MHHHWGFPGLSAIVPKRVRHSSFQVLILCNTIQEVLQRSIDQTRVVTDQVDYSAFDKES